jgi:hypothetical protein
MRSLFLVAVIVFACGLIASPANAQTLEETLSFLIYGNKKTYLSPTGNECRRADDSRCRDTFRITNRKTCEVELTTKRDGVVRESAGFRYREFIDRVQVYNFGMVNLRLTRIEDEAGGLFSTLVLESDEPINLYKGYYRKFAVGRGDQYVGCINCPSSGFSGHLRVWAKRGSGPSIWFSRYCFPDVVGVVARWCCV